jgi:16S rRNA (cytosine1402-N4)-methyltransferase
MSNETPSSAAPEPRGASPHIPVMLAEVLAALAPREAGFYIDATFGAGGYTRAILDAARCTVLGLDRDPSAIAAAAPLCAAYAGRLTVVSARFGDMAHVARDHPRPDGIVFDLGISSMQLDRAERGFSFQAEGPLDMRMGHADGRLSEGAGPSAAEVVNTAPEALLADILYQLGEERRSRAIAAAIVRRRSERSFATTGELASLVASVPGMRRPDGKHPATRTFQALRIWVNDELGELVRGLAAAEALLGPGGRLVVVTFHSLEDRIAKRFLAERSGRGGGASRHMPAGAPKREPSFRLVNSKSLSPGEDEISANPRARSARLRMAERSDAVAWSDGDHKELPEVLRHR